jgi:sirohydrochlorin ferrochelatase
MGVEHEADPAVPDPASHDHEDSPVFDVWATRDREAGPVLPAPASDAPADNLIPSDQAPGDQEDGPARPVDHQESSPALPTRIPQDQPGGSPLPPRIPGGQAGSSPPPTRTPRQHDSASQLPGRAPRGQDGASPLPGRAPRGQDGASPLPSPAPLGAQNGPALPVRNAGTPGDGSILPVRTSRYRRTGRHSSPHQLSLPSDTPALVIAVPGSARPESEDTVLRIAEIAGSSCHGAEVRVGYLRGSKDSLEEVVDELGDAGGGPAAVVVPLLAFPNAEVDGAIADVVAASPTPLLVAAHLGPHPLLAEALHARLAEAGLARASRVGRISIVTAADGVIVGAAGEDEAIEGAGVVAVLLASRLTMPVASASLTDPGSIKDAANRLREARVARVALAPCMIGPELTSGTLDAIAALTTTECAPSLGCHPAVAQLVAIRYGAALADPQVATMMAEARGEPLPAQVSPPATAT